MTTLARKTSVLFMLFAGSIIICGSRPMEDGLFLKIVTAIQRLQGGEA